MKRFLPTVKLLFGLAAAAFIVRAVWINGSKIGDLALHLRLLPLLAGLVVTLFSTLLITVLWTWIVQPENAFHRLLNYAYAKANLIRYIPGNVFGLGARVLFAQQHGVPRAVGTASLAVEGIILLATTGTLAFAMLWPAMVPMAAVGALVVLVIFSRAFQGRAGAPAPRRTVILYLCYLGYGLSLGLALNLFAISAQVSVSLGQAIGVFSLAWFLGYASLLTPSGLGVREGTIIFFLGPTLGAPAATFLALASRLAIVVTDVFVAGLFALLSRR